jgi:hypothetical protein
MLSVRQGTDSITTYTFNQKMSFDDVTANFEDPVIKGYISIHTLQSSAFLTGLSDAHQPMIDKIMLTGKSIHDLDLAQLQSDARDYEANRNSIKKQAKQGGNGGSHGGSDKQGGNGGKQNQGKGGNGTGRPSKEVLNYVQALSTLQLGAAQPTKLSKTGLPDRDKMYWKEHAHPHYRPKGPGGPVPTVPYCTHCYANGWIITDDRHVGNCSDQKRFLALPEALFNGVDYASLEVLAASAGYTHQNQY